jgi:UDP-GlcNAc:undecaprenyl-phosphate GlcNAc-1-phosphate transferase
MGDSGALLLGFLISALAILLRFWNLTPVTSWMIPVVVLAVPLFDITLVVLSRIRRGLSPASAGKDHLAHRISNRGFGNKKAVRIIYLATFLTGLLALLLTQVGMRVAILLFVGLIEIAIYSIAKLEDWLNHKDHNPPQSH